MVGGDTSGPETGTGEEIRMRFITMLLSKAGLLEGDLDYHLLRGSMVIILSFRVSEVVGLRGADADSLHQQRPVHLLDVSSLRNPGRELVPRSFGVVVWRVDLHRLLEQGPRRTRSGGLV